MAAAVRDHSAPPAGSPAQQFVVAAAAQLPGAGPAGPRVNRTDRSVPRGHPGRENRTGQGHSAHLAAGHREIRQRPAPARTALSVVEADRRLAAGDRPRRVATTEGVRPVCGGDGTIRRAAVRSRWSAPRTALLAAW